MDLDSLIFLQGLFFISPANLPKELIMAKDVLTRLYNIVENYKIEIANLAFTFVRDLPEVNSMVIGMEKLEQLKMNLKLLEEKPLTNELRQIIVEEFSDIPEKIVNPSLWNIS